MILRLTSLVLILLIILGMGNSILLGGSGRELTWHRYHDALALANQESRHILVRFTTKWCVFCRKMDETTYRDSAVVAILNKHFALAKVDGDSYNLVQLANGNITEKGLTRQYGIRGYPTTWFLEPDGSKIAPVTGYIDQIKLKFILDFIATDSNEKMSFKEFVDGQRIF